MSDREESRRFLAFQAHRRARETRNGRAPAADPGERSVVKIRAGRVVPAVFCVHSSSGSAAEFVELAGGLAEGQQFFGLQARGLVEAGRPLTTVEEMAESYLREARAAQPAGPYLFAGWSMGGYVAVEMARQAAAMGQEVPAVLLLAPPYEEARGRRAMRSEWAEARRLLKILEEQIDAVTSRTRSWSAGGEGEILPLWDLSDDPLRDPLDGSAQQLRNDIVNLTNIWAGRRYHAGMRRCRKPYAGRVVLVHPGEDPSRTKLDALAQWRSLLGSPPEVVAVPGSHESLVRGAGARTLGALLGAEITRCGRPAETTA
jgi:thioesterase domain-containing protein